VASFDNGIFTRGAAAMPIDAPAGVSIPFGPATIDSLVDGTPANTNGTDIAVASDGSLHVAWAAPDGLWYAGGSGTFTATQVIKEKRPLTVAGALGLPSVAVDDSATPWIATTMTTSGGGAKVVVATTDGTKWTTETVAEVPVCGGCTPARTQIGVTPDGPVVVYADPHSQSLMSAWNTGKGWASEPVESGITATGISLAVGKDGAVTVGYYTGKGEVHVASVESGGGVWSVRKAETTTDATGDAAAGAATGVAVDDGGATFLTWYDAASKDVKLAWSGAPGAFTTISTTDTAGGIDPDVGVAPDGSSIYLSWYDTAQQDMLLGRYGSTNGLVLAQPSPTPSTAPTSSPSGGGATCPKTGILVTAPAGAAGTGFAETSVTGSASATTLCLDNQDPTASSPHNVDILDKQGGTSLAKTTITQGPALETAPLPKLKPGDYYFQCDVHPTTMTGTLTIK
jgi:hypothetical protein